MSSEIVFKVTGPRGEAHIARNGFVWPLPSGKRPGKWVHAEGELQECRNGLHACRSVLHIGNHMNEHGFTVWFAEAKGDYLEGSGKVAFRSLRLLRKSQWCKDSAVLFAADCAERGLHSSKWDDERSWEAVTVSRKTALKLFESESAARSAARSAAESAAWSAAESAAGSAAWSAAGYAARYAARSAAWSAESAAGSAAWSAAGYAARYAARSAAESAAESAARSAEESWQEKRLLQYLEYGTIAWSMECEGWKPSRGLPQ